MNKKTKYPIIEVPASGTLRWYGGAYCYYFMYTKNLGNFIISGYDHEIKEYIKEKNITHYFVNIVFFGSSTNITKNYRNFWEFWKDGVYISDPKRPSRIMNRHKWETKYSVHSYNKILNKLDVEIKLKRIPHHWIPEFDKF